MIVASGASSNPLLIATVVGLLGMFSGGAVVALFRVNADRNRVVVDASQGAVIVQSGVIKDLRAELTRTQDEVHTLREKDAKKSKQLEACADEIRGLKGEIRSLHSEIDVLRVQISN